MGVKGLWTLLEPVGRRIDIEAISNKRLAVGKKILAVGIAGLTGNHHTYILPDHFPHEHAAELLGCITVVCILGACTNG